MSALERLERTVTFRAWCNGREIDSTDLRWSESFTEAENNVAPLTQHKAFVCIQRSDHYGYSFVWFYTVKKSTKRGRWRAAHDGGRKVFEGNLELVKVGEMTFDAFAPRRPFDALRDSPVTALQPHDGKVIEHG